ncbi:MAG: PDZ domain-containing protein [bacterium]|nr:PDZ domain-containing protein [bacterium]
MKPAKTTKWKTVLLRALILTVSISTVLAVPAAAGDPDDDDLRVIREVRQLRDCPEIQVLGAGNVKVLSMSPRGFLGVETSGLTPELRHHFGVPEDAGVLLSRVVDGSAAQAAGLLVGDIITRVGDEDIASAAELGRVVRQRDGGEVIDIEYWRDGLVNQTTATLEERERCAFDIGDYMEAIHLEDLPKLEDFGIEFSRESIESALETAREAIEGQDWQEHLQGLSLSEIDLERIEERMERVQERLERLEERLEREYGRDLERAERRAERDRERAERDRERAEREDGSVEPI